MKEREIAQQELLVRVAGQLLRTPSSTDHSMLTKWRVLSMCQYVLGGVELELEDACGAALDTFAAQGLGASCDKALEAANVVIKRVMGKPQTVLPTISKEKRAAVAKHLAAMDDRGAEKIELALRLLPVVRQRIKTTPLQLALPGIRYRFELVAAVLEDSSRPDRERADAAAAVLYVNEVRDVIHDTLGLIGLVDDDHALRVALGKLGTSPTGSLLHWSERISSLWDDLPFLQGVNLHRDAVPICVTWLDRLNSYISYCHVLGSERTPLLLLQPSVACSPLHAIVSLIGLLVLDAVTSSQSKAQALRVGQTYEVEGFIVRFEGTSGPPTPGWLQLRMREGVGYQPPALADRMIPIEARRLSSLREFSSRPRVASADPIQRFFAWDTAIGAASISSRLALVASRRRALDLLGGVQSNGVRLLDHGLVRFTSAVSDEVETHGTVILVVPSLSDARLLVDRGLHLQAVLVDGYEQLRRGRHELPFLMNRRQPPPIIIWSPKGYYPASAPTWLPPHKHLEVSPNDLGEILELDTASSDLSQASLWEAATGLAVQTRLTIAAPSENVVVEAIDEYLQAVRASQFLPEYWKYQLSAVARTLRSLIVATPAEWSEIKRFASMWSSSIDEKSSSLRGRAVTAMSGLRDAEKRVLKALDKVPEIFNSRATGLSRFLSEAASIGEVWHFVCDSPDQARATALLLRALGVPGIEPVLLHDLAVCSNCVVAGWISLSFARRLWAHTPRAIVALVDESDRQRWQRAAIAYRHSGGQSLLEAVGGVPYATDVSSSSLIRPSHTEPAGDRVDAEWGDDERVPCVLLWVTGKLEAKVLERDGRVVVEEGDMVREFVAERLRPDDRVILGIGTSRWSPADEFTGAVIAAVHKSHPQLVEAAKEWRRALQRLRDAQQLSTAELRARLVDAGVEREGQTLDGWLEIDRAAPIAPRGLRAELAALWPLVAHYAEHSLDDVASACARLRALRTASGRALLQRWKGRTVELGIDEAWLNDLVDRLRQDVQVCEIEAVTLGEVPLAMLGWWIPQELANRFESDSNEASPASEHAGEDDEGGP